ncbi:class II aaRS and biotin synthetase [Lenzites betulinus]|nr:class II aaRS and biotin synthetase [Lenzites betulinus]
MNVLVYSGPSTSPSSLSHTLTTLRAILLPHYAVQPAAHQSLAAQPWAATCALLVIPAFVPGTSGAVQPAAATAIQRYVERGGKVLIFGADVRVRENKGRISLSAGIENISLAEQGLFTLADDQTRLSLSVSLTKPSKGAAAGVPATLALADGSSIGPLIRAPNAAIDLTGIENTDGPTALASYGTAEESRAIAGVKTRIGDGAAIFWSVHLEYSLREEIASSLLAEDAPQASQDLAKAEEGRIRILRESLADLGLTLPAQGSGVARPTPQALTSAPWRPRVTRKVLKELTVPDLATASGEGFEIKDSNDTFIIHDASASSTVFGVDQAKRYEDEDPATWNPKHIVAFEGGKLPSRDVAPRFDLETYYAALADARKKQGLPENYADEGWGIGEALLYGDVVTSTQTMFDKNTRLLTTLPTPLLSLASSQLAGRGRGGNVWLSPPGCLQFSLLLRTPLSALPGQKIVFVQYLLALAVTEACRDSAVLGEAGARVRIKWPNDIYVEMPSTGEKRKIGGILVNTSFGAGRVELVIGCGLNVLNPPPIASLAQLLPPGSERHPTMEHTLAGIMTHFERMWMTFVAARGSFAPFMDLYLDRWLHSDQLVTLTTVTPPRKVRIVGLTPDHGLLRTLPERDGWGGGQGVEYIDLQPDGNSFDLMAGLIKTKT